MHMTVTQLCFGILMAMFVVNVIAVWQDIKRLDKAIKMMKGLDDRIYELEKRRFDVR